MKIENKFYKSELNNSTLTFVDNTVSNKNILYRCVAKENIGIDFILWDYKNLYYCHQNIDYVKDYQDKTNPSIEFSEIKNLLTFIMENIVNTHKPRKIEQIKVKAIKIRKHFISRF